MEWAHMKKMMALLGLGDDAVLAIAFSAAFRP
jgi:hypothetical protein